MKRVERLVGPEGARVSIVGGILGLAADAKTVADEFDASQPAALLLGVPYEDLDAVRATSGKEAESTFEASDLDELYLERLKKYGETRSPPPDLYEAFRKAGAAKVPVHAIDLGDEAYAETYAKNVSFFQVLKTNRANKRIPAQAFEAASAEEFALQWDDALQSTKGLRLVQVSREATMAKEIQAHAVKSPSVLALLPFARTQGVIKRLRETGWR